MIRIPATSAKVQKLKSIAASCFVPRVEFCIHFSYKVSAIFFGIATSCLNRLVVNCSRV